MYLQIQIYMQSCFGQNVRMRRDNKNKGDIFLIITINFNLQLMVNVTSKCIFYVII